MNNLLIAFACLFFASIPGTAQTPVLTPEDLKSLEGPKWSGTLTYLDYSSNKRTSIKSNLTVTRKAEKPLTWLFSYEYPDEPKANKASEAVLKDEGRDFLGQKVVEKTYLENTTLRFVTTQPGTDNNKKALFRYTYLANANSLSINKEVQIEGSSEWFLRNEYQWTR